MKWNVLYEDIKKPMEINLNFHTKKVAKLFTILLILMEGCFFAISMDIYHELSTDP